MMPVPTFALEKVPVPVKVTTSGETIPINDPVIVADVVASYAFVVTAALDTVTPFDVIVPVNPVGCVIE